MHADFVPLEREITADYGAGQAMPVMLHDGSRILLRKLAEDYDPTDAQKAYGYVQEHIAKGEVLTGLLHLRSTDKSEFHALNRTPDQPLNQLPYARLSPGSKALEKVLARYR